MLKLKKALITVAALAAFALGGAALAGATSSSSGEGDEGGGGPVPAGAKAAALKATGGGTIGQTERDGEQGATYEVEVVKPDGSQVDVRLADDLSLVAIDGDHADGPGEQSDGDGEDPAK